MRTGKVFIPDFYSDSELLPGAVEGAIVTLTAPPWREAKTFRVGQIIQDAPAVRQGMRFPDVARIRSTLEGRSRCANEFFDRMDAARGLLSAGLEDVHWRYKRIAGCPTTEGAFVPEPWASSPYVSPWRMEAMDEFNRSAMPLEAVNRIGEFTKEEICRMTPSFCAYRDVAAGLDAVSLPEARVRRRGAARVGAGVLIHLATFAAGLVAGMLARGVAGGGKAKRA